MNEFEPSAGFVAGVMKSVRKYEYEKEKITLWELIFSSKLHYVAYAGGLALGMVNFIRLYLVVFAPVICL